MLKTAKTLYQGAKALTVGLVVGKAQNFLARKFHEDHEDPLYYHWMRALDAVMVSSR